MNYILERVDEIALYPPSNYKRRQSGRQLLAPKRTSITAPFTAQISRLCGVTSFNISERSSLLSHLSVIVDLQFRGPVSASLRFHTAPPMLRHLVYPCWKSNNKKMTVDYSDQLLTFAEISIALRGGGCLTSR